MRIFLLFFLPWLGLAAADRTSVFPASAKPIGPYSPGIQSGDYVYISGQGARDANNNLPPTVEGQTRQALENIRAVVEAASLKMSNIIYMHVYMTDIKNYSAVNKAYAEFFPDGLPARSTMGVTRMPAETPVEINAIAIRDLSKRKLIAQPQGKSPVPISAGVETPDRVFLSGILGRDAVTGVTPKTPQGQVDVVLKRLRTALSAAKIGARQLVYLNVYRTPDMPRDLAARAMRHFASDAAISVVDVASLPFGTSIGVTAVAVRDLSQKHVFAQNGETICAGAGETIYCAAQHAEDATTALNTIDKGLKALGASLARAVANNVYMDSIDNFQTMNSAYAKAFPAPPPTRTTVQPMPASNSGVTIAVVAVK